MKKKGGVSASGVDGGEGLLSEGGARRGCGTGGGGWRDWSCSAQGLTEGEVEHAVEVEDPRQLGLDLLDAPQHVLDPRLHVARGRAHGRALRGALGVPLLDRHELVAR